MKRTGGGMYCERSCTPLAATMSTGAFCLIECHGGRMHRRQTVARSAVDFRFQLLNHHWDERPPCPLVADFVEKPRRQILLAISVCARVRRRMDDSICPPLLNHCCVKNHPELHVGEFFNTIGTYARNQRGQRRSGSGSLPDVCSPAGRFAV
jgi:hypothetical protein